MEHQPSEWMFAPEVQPNEEEIQNSGGHGSCVASKAVGARNGVSKRSNLVIIKASYSPGDIAYAFSAALQDIIDKDRQRRSVVVFAAQSNSNVETKAWKITKQAIKDLFAADAVVVAPSGNRGAFPRAKKVNSFPGLWEIDDYPLIVVGAVNNEGRELVFSQGPEHVVTWAPDRVICAKGANPTASDVGTSFASGMVEIYPP